MLTNTFNTTFCLNKSGPKTGMCRLQVLRVVGAMVLGAACYLAAFTATAACEEGAGCARAAWHHVTAGAELLLLLAGVRIAYAARNANVPFQVLLCRLG